jgi:TATA-binding protein-associated factor Taf7
VVKTMANRDLLKEAIADAKSVKEAAIANAKAALEEAFTPYLKEKFTAKLAEMEARWKLKKKWKKTTAKRKWKRKCQIQ